ncbi:MAG: hypothetical protein HCA25_10390 [Dolichospermum sp. DET50]|nr:hypothetical protein [Dolichospermum sp. DET66]MBS3032673.1 hypothetical protein [Dolichospermum sp. DET67]MBS3037879.1 hypothetical protein [Dolichospermum sp. DET50]QSX69808.1 MAG: hypothetical protein EZY12_09610 [Dolichospermum sp. DET69]
MKRKMLMNKKLKLARMYLSSEEGFAMPIAVGLGLVMIITGLTMIVRSQSDTQNASSQKSTKKALSVAEVGITRYQQFINNNRVLSVYNDCVGTRSNGTCPDTTQKSWSNASVITQLDSGCGVSATTTSTISDNSNTAWKDISSTDSSLGQYKLVKYEYIPNTGVSDNTAPGVGKLTVQGRVKQQGSGSTATSGFMTATSQLAVTFPVSTSPSTAGVAGLWSSSFSMVGNATSNADVFDSSCNSSTAFNSANLGPWLPSPPYTSQTAPKVTKSVKQFPSLPNNNVYTVPSSNINTISSISLGANNTMTLPRANDVNASGGSFSTGASTDNGTYVYNLTGSSSLSLTGNGTLNLGTTNGSCNQTIIIYADGNLDLTGNGTVNPTQCGTVVNGRAPNSTKVIFYLGSNASLTMTGNGTTNPSSFQFYVYSQAANAVTFTGNGTSNAFIFAPFTETRMVGNGTINGALWSKSLTATGNGTINQYPIAANTLQVPISSNDQNQLNSLSSWTVNPVSP